MARQLQQNLKNKMEKQLPKELTINLLLLVSAGAIFYIISFASKDILWTDYFAWNGDAVKMSECFNEIKKCDISKTISSFSKFPFGYFLTGLTETTLSKHNGDSLRAINTLGLTIPLLGILISNAQISTKTFITAIYVIVIGFSPIALVYINSGALEVLQGSFLALYLTVRFFKSDDLDTKGKQAVRFLCLFVCCLFKDTFILTLISAEIAFYVFETIRTKPRKRKLTHSKNYYLSTGDFAGLTAGTLLSIAYNLARYQSIIPISYINEAKEIPVNLKEYFQNYLAAIASPNGGLIFFYGIPISIILISIVLVNKEQKNINKVKEVLDIQPMCSYCAIITLTSLAFTSKWWAAFGWVSWGNRLVIPWASSIYITSAICGYHALNTITQQNQLTHLINSTTFRKTIWLTLISVILFTGLHYATTSIGMDHKKIGKRIDISKTCVNFTTNYYDRRDSYSPQTLIYTLPIFKQCTTDRFWQIVND